MTVRPQKQGEVSYTWYVTFKGMMCINCHSCEQGYMPDLFFFFFPFSFQEIINCLQALRYFETGITAHPLVRRYQQTQISA